MNTRTQKITRGALIAAIYALLCYVLAPISYGAVQIRISEALTLLPVLSSGGVFGVTLGCFLANMLSGSPIDMVVGTLTTFLAALATRRLRKVRWRGLPVAAALPPILFNAVIIGLEITLLTDPASPWWLYLFNMATVGAGQIISCGLGVLLVGGIEKNPSLLGVFSDEPKVKR